MVIAIIHRPVEEISSVKSPSLATDRFGWNRLLPRKNWFCPKCRYWYFKTRRFHGIENHKNFSKKLSWAALQVNVEEETSTKVFLMLGWWVTHIQKRIKIADGIEICKSVKTWNITGYRLPANALRYRLRYFLGLLSHRPWLLGKWRDNSFSHRKVLVVALDSLQIQGSVCQCQVN